MSKGALSGGGDKGANGSHGPRDKPAKVEFAIRGPPVVQMLRVFSRIQSEAHRLRYRVIAGSKEVSPR